LGYSTVSAPLDSNQNVPLGLLPRSNSTHLPSRRSIKSKDVENLAIEIFRRSKKGITFGNVIEVFGVSKKRAQRKLKDCSQNDGFPSEKRVLFAPERHKPQHYYPKCLRAEVNEYLAKKRNVLVQPTGVTSSKHPLSNALELQKAQTFLDTLARLPFVPPYVHKLQFLLAIDKEAYITLEHPSHARNRAKRYEEYIGKTRTSYTYSPNGTAEIAVECSNYPFKLETDDDVSILFSFFGQVRDRMLYHLSDPRERIVPPIICWRLIQCDFNKDIGVSDKMQLTLPDMQLKYAGRVFRAYVKSLSEKAVFRCEESLKVDSSLVNAFSYIHNPNKTLERKVDELIQSVQRLSSLFQDRSKGSVNT
jgi:hypothetical protein